MSIVEFTRLPRPAPLQIALRWLVACVCLPGASTLTADPNANPPVQRDHIEIRGGTDGSRLSKMGLATPNLSTGMHNFCSPLEYARPEEMEPGVKVLIELAQLWAKA